MSALAKAKRKWEWEPRDESAKDFARRATPVLQAKFTDGLEDAEGFGAEVDWDWANPKAVDYARERGAELVGRRYDEDGNLVDNPSAYWAIEETTRADINGLLQDAIEEGWSIGDFKRYLDGSGVFEPARAETIARTEIALAQQGGRVAAYREAGVEYVYVSDEAECGLPICEDADGELWTLDEAEEDQLGHPNCTRSFRPATKDEAEEAAGEEADDAEAEAEQDDEEGAA